MNIITGNGTDDTANLQQAIDDITTTGGRILLEGVIHLSEIDLTNRHSITIEGDGVGASEIVPLGNTNSVLDLTGSYYINLKNFKLGQHDQTAVPKMGILVAQNALHQSNRLLFDNIQVDGKYSVAALYYSGISSSTIRDCAFWNYHNNYNYTATFTKNNLSAMVSSFATIPNDNFPSGDINIFGTEFHAMVPAGGAINYPLRLHDMTGMKFFGGNVSGSGSELVTLNSTNNLLLFHGTAFYSENGTPPGAVFSNLGICSNIELRKCAVPAVPVFSGPNAYSNATQA